MQEIGKFFLELTIVSTIFWIMVIVILLPLGFIYRLYKHSKEKNILREIERKLSNRIEGYEEYIKTTKESIKELENEKRDNETYLRANKSLLSNLNSAKLVLEEFSIWLESKYNKKSKMYNIIGGSIKKK